MAVNLIVENGSGITNANGYVSVADANTYNDEHPHGSTWLTVSTTDKARSIIMATRILDEQCDWYGQPTYNLESSVSSSNTTAKVQYLRWPRSGVYDLDGYVLDHNRIPDFLKDVTSEFARYLASDDRTAEPDTQGFGAVRLGSLNVTVDKFDQPPILPRSVIAMVKPYGTIRGGASGMTRRA